MAVQDRLQVQGRGTAGSTRDGRSELTVRRDPATGKQIRQLTRSDEASFHSYYDLCPWNARGDKAVF